MPKPVALLAQANYNQPALQEAIFRLLDSTLKVTPGTVVLVKPNLLMAHKLACTNPEVVAAVCEWLLAKNAKIIVADSPAFGTAEAVSRAIGLEAALKPLGLKATNFKHPVPLDLPLVDDRTKVRLGVDREALECDTIFSIPRVKAHSQMRITLAVKNCYGCICGIRKAIAHVRFGQSVAYFADCVAALWAALPPVAALCDGITAMSVTGPRNGKPFHMGLLAASASAPCLDAALLSILKIDPATIPLSQALTKRGVNQEPSAWPLAQPQDFDIKGFEVPQQLKDISFNPLVLGKSILKRLWFDLRH